MYHMIVVAKYDVNMCITIAAATETETTATVTATTCVGRLPYGVTGRVVCNRDSPLSFSGSFSRQTTVI